MVKIDPATGKTESAPITVGNGPAGIAIGADGSVWVANSLDETVTRIDPATNTPDATVSNVGNGPSGVAVDAAGVWVSNQFDGTLALISPSTNVSRAGSASGIDRRALRSPPETSWWQFANPEAATAAEP